MTQSKTIIPCILIIWLLSSTSFSIPVNAVTDTELEALEKQLEQQEQEARKQAEEIHKAEQEKQLQLKQEQEKKEEERKRQALEAQKLREMEKQKILDEEQRTKEQEQRLKAEKEKQKLFNKHIRLAESYMSNDDFEKAISEYEKALIIVPAEESAITGINEAKKFLNACNDFVGKWFLEPNGITWQVHEDKTVFGTWLIFSSNGFWECVDARKKEVVVSWPDCGVCLTEYLYLSPDGRTLKSSRGTATTGKKIDDSSKEKQHPPVKL